MAPPIPLFVYIPIFIDSYSPTKYERTKCERNKWMPFYET